MIDRYVLCDGLCGRHFAIPCDLARKIMTPTGNTRTHPMLLCDYCVMWLCLEIEGGLLINNQLLLEKGDTHATGI